MNSLLFCQKSHYKLEDLTKLLLGIKIVKFIYLSVRSESITFLFKPAELNVYREFLSL